MAFISGGSRRASFRQWTGPGSALNAAASQAPIFVRAVAWQAPQPLPSFFPLALNLAKAAPECGSATGPGLISFHRVGPARTINRVAMLAVTTIQVNKPRLARALRTGAHLGMSRLHVPSGMGPCSQGPPYSFGRVQR